MKYIINVENSFTNCTVAVDLLWNGSSQLAQTHERCFTLVCAISYLPLEIRQDTCSKRREKKYQVLH